MAAGVGGLHYRERYWLRPAECRIGWPWWEKIALVILLVTFCVVVFVVSPRRDGFSFLSTPYFEEGTKSIT